MRRTLVVLVVLALALLLLAPAAMAAPGKAIQDACGAPFGQLIVLFRTDELGGVPGAAHPNYAGGANAFANPAVLAAHGCG